MQQYAKVFTGALASLTIAIGAAHAADIVGLPGKISDGDTLYVCDAKLCHKIRICGIDAPERKKKGGRAARKALVSIVKAQTIRCRPVGEGTVCDGRSKRTNRDRIVAQCFVGEADIADMMIAKGHACDWVKFSGGYYSRKDKSVVCVE